LVSKISPETGVNDENTQTSKLQICLKFVSFVLTLFIFTFFFLNVVTEPQNPYFAFRSGISANRAKRKELPPGVELLEKVKKSMTCCEKPPCKNLHKT